MPLNKIYRLFYHYIIGPFHHTQDGKQTLQHEKLFVSPCSFAIESHK